MKADGKSTPAEEAKFQISSSHQGFSDRQKNVFDQLNILEHSSRSLLSNNEPLMDIDEPSDGDTVAEDVIRTGQSRHESKIKHLRGRESIFKRPQARAPRSVSIRKVPDYQIHPHKWTRYSLDVPNEDMSDRANTTAALSFLKEIKLRKEQTGFEDQAETTSKIIFKKATVKKLDGEETKTTQIPVFRNSKVIMPEYIVGEKIKKEKKLKKKKIEDGGSSKEIKLDHLFENEED